MDRYTERTTTGLGSRLGQSLKGAVFGLILFIAAFPVLWLNEGYAVRTASSLNQGARAVVSAVTSAVRAANEGKLVHVTGRAETAETVADPVFGVSGQGIRLRRKVEMYQWKESSSSRKRTNVGGSETTATTYDYNLVWSESAIDSSGFKRPQEHQNPPMPFTTADYFAEDVRLGAFRLTREIVSQLAPVERVDISGVTLPPTIASRARMTESGVEVGDVAAPKAGDLRISFTQLKAPEVSVVARQAGNTFAPYRAEAGGTIQLVAMGIQTAEAMIATAQTRNTVRTWILRAVGFVLMFFGLALLLSPLSTAADVLPFLGGLLRAGTGLLSAVAAVCFSVTTIAMAWIAHRPLFGLGLLIVAVVLLYTFVRSRSKAGGTNARSATAS